jgi:vacuolar protein sorting-associated protein 13A/C
LIPFQIHVLDSESRNDAGKCFAKNKQGDSTYSTGAPTTAADGIYSKKTNSFSIPVSLLADFCKDWESYGQAKLTLAFVPLFNENDGTLQNVDKLTGNVDFTPSLHELKRASNGKIKSRHEVICRPSEDSGRDVHPFALQVLLTTHLVGNESVFIDVALEPRAVIENKIPLAMKMSSPMPHTYSLSKKVEGDNMEMTFELDPDGRVEVFTPGPSIAITLRTRDNPVAGTELGWMDAGWVDLPLVPEFRLQDPIITALPFVGDRGKLSGEQRAFGSIGAEVCIVEGKDALETMAYRAANQSPESPVAGTPPRTNILESRRNASMDGPASFFLTVCNYGVDHTGNMLFEPVLSTSHHGLRMMTTLWQSERSVNSSRHSGIKNSFLEDIDAFTGIDTSRLSSVQTKVPGARPLGAFSSPRHRKRITLLPNVRFPIRMLHMTMEGEEGLKRTLVSMFFLLFLFFRLPKPIISY